MKHNLASVGRGALNLMAVLVVIFGFQYWLRSRSVPDSLGVALMAIIVLASYFAGSRLIERRQPTELLARAGAVEFPLGVAFGCLLFVVVMMLLWAFGDYQLTGWRGLHGLAAGFLFALLSAVVEETLFRGFLFRLTSKLLGTWGALTLTSALFGAAHAFNKGATVWSSIAIALEAGVLLGAAYAATQRLWLPIGLHLGWNFTEGSIFGMSVSGGSSQNSLIKGTLQGPDYLSGGIFGPEASIVAVLVCLTAATILLRRTVRLRRVEPPIWADALTAPRATVTG